MSLVASAVRHLAADTARGYARRVRVLAACYGVLNVTSIAAIALVSTRGRFLVTLAQRSNVETLTLVVVAVLALQYLLTTGRGALGAVRIAWLAIPRSRHERALERERRKHAAIRDGSQVKTVYLDKRVAADASPGPLVWTLGDEAGVLGELRIAGAEMEFRGGKTGLSNSFFDYVANQIERIARRGDPRATLHVVFWASIDDDLAAAYAALLGAVDNLSTAVGRDASVWPAITLGASELRELTERIHEVLPAVRSECLLPDVEYQAEYRVPVLPEPLGLVQLSRQENRADPVGTMGCAALVMLMVVAVLIAFVWWPPWVPSK